MVTHRSILIAAAKAVADDETLLAFSCEHFGRGLAVHVGAYAMDIPGEDEAPFVWIRSAEGDHESVKADETFTLAVSVGACMTGEDGEKKLAETIRERTGTANGLTVNGGNLVTEELRDRVLAVIRAAQVGAIPDRVRVTADDLSHFPLEWAEGEVDYIEFESL